MGFWGIEITELYEHEKRIDINKEGLITMLKLITMSDSNNNNIKNKDNNYNIAAIIVVMKVWEEHCIEKSLRCEIKIVEWVCVSLKRL